MGKTVGIMQPYFLPYLGYFQLMSLVDEFVLYDNIQYTKKGWINRNNYLSNGNAQLFSIPLKKDSDYLHVHQRVLADSFFITERPKLIRTIKGLYKKAPQFMEVMPLIEAILSFEESNLFKFIYNSILRINQYLSIETSLVVSSDLNIDHSLKSQDKVIAICKALNAQQYINPIGGVALYDPGVFLHNGLKLGFLKMNAFTYDQFKNTYVPNLSILDVLMFNDLEEVHRLLFNEFKLQYEI